MLTNYQAQSCVLGRRDQQNPYPQGSQNLMWERDKTTDKYRMIDEAAAEVSAGATGALGGDPSMWGQRGWANRASQGRWPLTLAEGSIVHQAGEKGGQKPENKGPSVTFLGVGNLSPSQT